MDAHIFLRNMVFIIALSLAAAPQMIAQKVFLKEAAPAKSAPSLKTSDRLFAADETITITGEGFGRYEQIDVSVRELRDSYKNSAPIAGWIIYADADGRSRIEWQMPHAGRFEIKATGADSALAAKTVVSSLVPSPVLLRGNPTCASVNASTDPALAHVYSNYGFKLDFSNPNGTYAFQNTSSTTMTGGAPQEPSNSVTVSTTNNGRDLAWSATRQITAVIIKGGPDANVYPYNPFSTGDPGPLTTPNGTNAISHVEFCFQPTATIIIKKHASPPSSNKFDFTASPDLSPANFYLVDDSSTTDPMRVFTVNTFGVKTITETNPGAYTLRSIDCTVDIGTGGTPQPVRNGNSINIDIKPGDQVTCTFNNDIVTAAEVSVSGRVFTPGGTGLYRAYVSITDLEGNVRTTMTNPFGYFRFEGVEAGESYFFNVNHKRYRFSPQFVDVSDQLEGINFYPVPR